MHGARREFIQTEADERIKRALRNTVKVSEEIYENGDVVIHKQEGKKLAWAKKSCVSGWKCCICQSWICVRAGITKQASESEHLVDK